MLSDAIYSYGEQLADRELSILANGCLTAAHATQFCAFVRQVRGQYSLHKILSGEQSWPDKPEERDILYFLAQSLRAQPLKELPRNRGQLSGEARQLATRAKELLLELSNISLEIAQMAVTPEGEDTLPAWFLTEVVRELPALALWESGSTCSPTACSTWGWITSGGSRWMTPPGWRPVTCLSPTFSGAAIPAPRRRSSSGCRPSRSRTKNRHTAI